MAAVLSFRGLNRWPQLALLLAAAAIAAGLAGYGAWLRGIAGLQARLGDKASITGHLLAAEVERLRHLPVMLGEDARLRLALETRSPAQIAAANAYLRRTREVTGADEAYLIAPDGVTLAASNWDEPGSYVGANYGFRPYFRDALRDGIAYYYAIGVTTGRPGAFLSARIGPDNAPLGVAVVKMELDDLELAWTRAGELTAVADADGVIFLASPPGWRFRPLRALDADSLARITAEQRYGELSLAEALPLPIHGGRLAVAGGSDLMLRSDPVAGTDWQLLVALPVTEARIQALLIALVTGTAGLLLSVLAVTWTQRRQILRLRLQEADRLEARVEERTRALAAEVEERGRAEAELRRSHESLIHAAKLAVLGRMSAAIVHEVGQALSALDNNLAAAEAHGARGKPEKLAPALARARAMLLRLQGVVSRLRGFGGRQVPVTPAPVRIGQCLLVATELVEPRRRELGVALTLPEGGPDLVLADGPRLEQVLTNLLLNAIEACARGATPPQVEIATVLVGGRVEISIRDSGPGLPPGQESSVTEPFFTTREREGLGLGLYIVQALLEQMQGELAFATDGPGATAIIRLPAAALTESAP